MSALEAAKRRLSEAAARCLAGDRDAPAAADTAMAEVKRLLDAVVGNESRTTLETVSKPFANGLDCTLAEAGEKEVV